MHEAHPTTLRRDGLDRVRRIHQALGHLQPSATWQGVQPGGPVATGKALDVPCQHLLVIAEDAKLAPPAIDLFAMRAAVDEVAEEQDLVPSGFAGQSREFLLEQIEAPMNVADNKKSTGNIPEVHRREGVGPHDACASKCKGPLRSAERPRS